MMIVTAARDANPHLRIIARTATEDGVRHLAKLGADHVVHPELEGGLELMQHLLLSLDFPLPEVHEYAEAVRRDRYDYAVSSVEEHRSLHALLGSLKGVEIIWLAVSAGSPLVGQSLAEANLRAQRGLRRGPRPRPEAARQPQVADGVCGGRPVGGDRRTGADRGGAPAGGERAAHSSTRHRPVAAFDAAPGTPPAEQAQGVAAPATQYLTLRQLSFQ